MNNNRNRTNHNILNSWDESSAYFLGLWLADGSITLAHTHKNRISTNKRVKFFSTDRELANIMAKLLNSSVGTETRKPPRKTGYYVQVYSDKLFDVLYDITQTTRKSQSGIAVPKLPRRLFHHFVRGFFDGDGSISIKHYKNRHGKMTEALQSSFTAGNATGNFLEDLRDEIRKHVPVGMKKVSEGVSRHLVFNQYDTMLLCEWMYKDSTLFLKRKKTIWDSCDKERLLRSKKWFSNKV